MEDKILNKWLVIGVLILFFGAGIVKSINININTNVVHGESDSWWDDDWLYRKKINVNSEMVEGSHVNFPVLIKLESDDDLAAKAQSDGDDIVFTDYSGTKLNHEIESYNNESGGLIAWVNAESLTSESILYMYYGNSTSSDQQNIERTWDSSYKGVWHLNENPGDTAPQYKDSTIYGNDGTAKNMELEDQIPGKINYAVRLNEGYNNPPQEYIDCGSDSSIRITQDITVSS